MISSVCMHGHTQSMEYRVPPLTIATSPSISIRCLFTAFRLPTSDRSWSCKNRALKFSCRRQVLFKSRCVILCRWYSQELKDSGAQVDYTPFQKEVEIKALNLRRAHTHNHIKAHQHQINFLSDVRVQEKGYDLLVHDFRTKEQTHSDNVDRQGGARLGPRNLSMSCMPSMLGCAARMREGFEEATCFT